MKRQKLRGRIVEKYGTNLAFADAIGVTPMTVTNVIHGHSTPTAKRMPEWCSALDIAPEEIGIFFYPETTEN